MHNYIATNNTAQKKANWDQLTNKVRVNMLRTQKSAMLTVGACQIFKRLGLRVTKDQIEGIVASRPMHIERLLLV
eukprot:SAG31_NODE_30275_length_383_cov_0.908451_1_plen_75_part_00